MNKYSLLADIIVIFHFIYVIFVVFGEIFILLGGFFKWAWIRNIIFRGLHLAAILIVAFEAVFGIWCPLTIIEYNLRSLAGQTSEETIPFIANIVRSIIFYDLPTWVFTIIYILFFLLVVLTLIFIPPKFRKKPSAGNTTDSQ
ncbi:MAG: DUF2784 domain-containing protein [Spirochaetes bacterium]|nr:DUF2784 domain-containing protein [Spirochaetota bacterium]